MHTEPSSVPGPRQNRTAVITGGGSGIGRAIAIGLSARGERVAILDLASASDVVGAINASGGTALSIACDVTDNDAVVAAFSSIHRQFESIDVLVNSAGIAHVGNIEGTTDDDIDRVYAVNVKGTYHCMRAAIPFMKGRGGAILNMASVAGSVGIPDRFAYSMSKGAVVGMTLSVARDYVQQNIRCNCLSPARVHTPFVDGFLAKTYPGREREMFEQLSATQPIGRMGTPQEIAQLACYLCSDDAAFITGCNYAIDGGFISLKM